MNNNKLKAKVRETAKEILKEKIFIAPVDLLMEMDVLTQNDYENWRKGRVAYLEKVCNKNLSKMSLIMKELRAYAKNNGLKSSWTAYRKWGKGKKIKLQFSKSGNPKIEEAYSTHYVDSTRT